MNRIRRLPHPERKIKKITSRDRRKILRTYNNSRAKGIERDDILCELAKQYKRSPRQIERYIAKARDEISKARSAELAKEKHWDDLANELLKLISNLSILQKYKFLGDLAASEVHVNPTDEERLKTVDLSLAEDLLVHLSKQVPEVAHLDSWDKIKLTDIKEELLQKLRLIAYRRDFSSTCKILQPQKPIH